MKKIKLHLKKHEIKYIVGIIFLIGISSFSNQEQIVSKEYTIPEKIGKKEYIVNKGEQLVFLKSGDKREGAYDDNPEEGFYTITPNEDTGLGDILIKREFDDWELNGLEWMEKGDKNTKQSQQAYFLEGEKIKPVSAENTDNDFGFTLISNEDSVLEKEYKQTEQIKYKNNKKNSEICSIKKEKSIEEKIVDCDKLPHRKELEALKK